MDLGSFRHAVDSCADGITPHLADPSALYAYVGLPIESHFARQRVSEELNKKTSAAFKTGHRLVWQRCRQLRDEFIQRHVIDGETLDPYLSILDNLQEAVRVSPQIAGEVEGDWVEAVRWAYDSVRLFDWSPKEGRKTIYARTFAVAAAAKRLQTSGFQLQRVNGEISVEPKSEARLIAQLERTLATMGGINVARRIFRQITPLYDVEQERYHLVNRPQPTGAGSPQIPFGYLLLLAAKHFVGTKPFKASEEIWAGLCLLATDYAATFDVQNYSHTFVASMDAVALLPFLHKLALYDTLFRIPQIRGSDIDKIARGILHNYDLDRRHPSGWSLNDVLAVIAALLNMSLDHRGPISFTARQISSICNRSEEIVFGVMNDVLCHPQEGANRLFSKPTDAPTNAVSDGKAFGHNFYNKPLLSADRKSFWLLDRSMCAAACLESLFTVLRGSVKDFDGKLGGPIENFLKLEFSEHNVPTLSGKYVVDGEDGECDLVVETPQAIIFLEIKKKPLTRKAQAGSEAHVLLDLANSLLAAQVQAGWHEVRLRRKGYLDLEGNGVTTRLELKDRQIERIAVSLLQFGSFQDRMILKQFLEGTLRADFSVNDPAMEKDFAKFNALLGELRQQVNILHAGEEQLDRPFFHCWFLSIPQLLVCLDDVENAEAFKQALWKTRHIVTGSSDFYADNAMIRKWTESAALTV